MLVKQTKVNLQRNAEFYQRSSLPGTVAHNHNPSTQEVQARGSLSSKITEFKFVMPVLHNKFKTSLNYPVRPPLKKQDKTKQKTHNKQIARKIVNKIIPFQCA